MGVSVCIGLSTEQLPVNALVGSSSDSIGLYSSGHLVAGSRWVEHGSGFACGSTVGGLVHLERCADADQTDDNDGDGAMQGDCVVASVQFSVNGEPVVSNAQVSSTSGFASTAKLEKKDVSP